ncbi:B12-binding domain-containing radical SAM protein [Chloroflexota bacterium]
MKRILLIAPPFYRLLGSHYNGLHLGIAYIAAILKEHGHFVKIYNADYCEIGEYANQRQLFENYTSYKAILNDPVNPIWGEIKDNISNFTPDIVGITMLTANYKAARMIARITRSINSDIKIVVGGAHPTLDPEETLAEEDFDYVIRGEGEFTFLELANNQSEDEIKGLSFKKNKKVVHNESRPPIEDLDVLPYPSRDTFLNDTKNLDVGYLVTGRGCPFSCKYCASPQLWHKIVRLRSVSNVLGELEYLKTKHNSVTIHFADDTFTLDRRRAKEICRQIIGRRLDIEWTCDTRADCLDKELITLMKKAGCVKIKIGVESGSDRILKMMQKGVTKDKIRQAVDLIKGAGLHITAYLMAGFPDETNEDLLQTIKFARELDADYYSLGIVAPYYGTEIWNDLVKSGNKPDKEHWDYFYHQSQEMLINDDLDPELISRFWALNETQLGEKRRV